MSLSRRRFLQGSAAVAGAAALPSGLLFGSPVASAQPALVKGATVNPHVYGIRGWVKGANIFDSYVGMPLAKTIQKVYMPEGSFPSNPFPADMVQLSKVGCQFIVNLFPSRTTDQSAQLATYLSQLTAQGYTYRVAIPNEWNTHDRFTPSQYQSYWAQYAPVVKSAGVPLCCMICATSNATAFAKIEPGFPTSPLPDQYWIDYYAEAYHYNVRLDTRGGLLDQADSFGVPVGIGESGWSATGGTRVTMTDWHHYTAYLASLAPRLALGALYWGSGSGPDNVTSASDPKVPGIQQYMDAL